MVRLLCRRRLLEPAFGRSLGWYLWVVLHGRVSCLFFFYEENKWREVNHTFNNIVVGLRYWCHGWNWRLNVVVWKCLGWSWGWWREACSRPTRGVDFRAGGKGQWCRSGTMINDQPSFDDTSKSSENQLSGRSFDLRDCLRSFGSPGGWNKMSIFLLFSLFTGPSHKTLNEWKQLQLLSSKRLPNE